MEQWIGKRIRFTDKIEEMESYPEGGMRARIVSIKSKDTDISDLSDHLYLIEFDYSEYDDFNRLFESANYYGRDQVPNKTAREADHYKKLETIYFGSPQLYPFEDYFQLASQRHEKLHEQFAKSSEDDYVSWLEQQVETE